MNFPSRGRRPARTCNGRLLKAPALYRVLHVLSLYCTIAINFPNPTVYWNGIENNCDGQLISPGARYALTAEGGRGRGGRSVHVKSHIKNRPKLARFAFSKISTPMNFPSQDRRPSNLHWTSPQGPGTVSCTAHTTVVLYHCRRIPKWHSAMERNRKEL